MYPKVNQNVVITIKSMDQSCRSIIAEISDSEILISFPMDRHMIGLLSDGTQLEITFISGGQKYLFETVIIGRKMDTIPLFRINKPNKTDIIKIQQRDNFRVPTNLRLIINSNVMSTINISAGGILFSCRMDISLEEGQAVLGTVYVPNIQNKTIEPITFQGQIKRIILVKDQDRKNVAMEYENINLRDQQKIIQYCFEKQRQNRLMEREIKN